MKDYEFVCQYCDNHFTEGFISINGKPPKCPKCGDRNVKKVSKGKTINQYEEEKDDKKGFPDDWGF